MTLKRLQSGCETATGGRRRLPYALSATRFGGRMGARDRSMDLHLPSPWIVAVGWLIGFLIGMTGVGAGSLTTPMLISGFGLPPVVAVGTDLLFASITKATAAWR